MLGKKMGKTIFSARVAILDMGKPNLHLEFKNDVARDLDLGKPNLHS